MKILTSITAALLFLCLVGSTPAFTQDERPDHAQDQQSREKDKDKAKQDDKARQDENRRDVARPENRQQDNERRDERNPNARPEAARPQEQTHPQEQRDEHAVRPQEHSQEQARPEEHRDQRAEGHRGQRIPEERFRTSFGREHHFHVDRREIVNRPQPEFVYGGYTFQLAQPWPAEWSYDDDCYVDYEDGDYYLYDAYHPGIRILVFVLGD